MQLYRQLNPDDPEVPPNRAERVWRAMRDVPGREVLVAEVGGRVVGTVDLTITPNLTRGARPVLIVENVVVDAEARRQGVGRLLLDEAAHRGRAAGCYKLQLSAADPEAFAFYEAAGLAGSARTYKRYLS